MVLYVVIYRVFIKLKLQQWVLSYSKFGLMTISCEERYKKICIPSPLMVTPIKLFMQDEIFLTFENSMYITAINTLDFRYERVMVRNALFCRRVDKGTNLARFLGQP